MHVENMFAYVLNDSGVEVFPELGRAENAGLLQMRPVYLLNTRPPHEFRCREALHQCAKATCQIRRAEIKCRNILVKLQFWEGRVIEEAMEHIGLFVVMRCENDVVDNVFQSLGRM